MAMTTFIPTIWAGQLLISLKDALVYGSVFNRQYEGEIRDSGDSVKINSVSPVTIGDYTRDTDLADPETLNGAAAMLLIDVAKSFHFYLDDIDKVQMSMEVVSQVMQEAAHGLARAADTHLSTKLVAAVPAANLLSAGSTIVPTATTAYEWLVDLGVILDENNVPEDGRWVVIPAWYGGLLEKDPRFTGYGTPGNRGDLANGLQGPKVAGLHVMKSNTVPNTTGALYKIVAGHTMAATFAEQIVHVEGYRPQKRFGDAMKGLHVYGSKVVRPNVLAMGTFSKS